MIDKLIKEAEENNLTIKEVDSLPDKFNGIIINNDIVIRKNLSSPEKTVTLAEEIEHYNANIGNIIDIRDTSIKKQELLARWSTYEKLLPIEKIISAIISGVSNSFEFAEFLELPEGFAMEAINYYKQRYGSIEYKNYRMKFGRQLYLYKLSEVNNKLNVKWIDETGSILHATDTTLFIKSSLGVDTLYKSEISKVKLLGLNLIVYDRTNKIERVINVPAERHKDAVKICEAYKELNIFESYIAGITKANDLGEDIQSNVRNYIDEDNSVEIGKIKLVQEPENPYDRLAVKLVHDELGHVGYIPAKHNFKINNLINDDRIVDIMWKLDKENVEVLYFKLLIRYR